jgi:DTW domain-containing protein YfiP
MALLRRGLCTAMHADPAAVAALEARLRPLLPAPAATLLDDGLLARILAKRDPAKKRLAPGFATDETRRLLDAARTDEERHEASVSMTFISRRLSMLLRGHCDVCCYTKARCMCDALEPRLTSRHTLWLFQNVGEFGRQNNSGRLLCMLLGARLSTQGLRCEMDEMMAHAAVHRDSAVVLFPTADAVTIDQYQAARAARLGPAFAAAHPLTVFLPDGTSNQAKNLEKHLPEFLPRVRLNTTAMRSWLDPIRRQTEEHRVCTAQAAAALLAELGEDDITVRVKELVDLFVRRTETDRAMPA